jgi:hypothetical protein
MRGARVATRLRSLATRLLQQGGVGELRNGSAGVASRESLSVSCKSCSYSRVSETPRIASSVPRPSLRICQVRQALELAVQIEV